MDRQRLLEHRSVCVEAGYSEGQDSRKVSFKPKSTESQAGKPSTPDLPQDLYCCEPSATMGISCRAAIEGGCLHPELGKDDAHRGRFGVKAGSALSQGLKDLLSSGLYLGSVGRRDAANRATEKKGGPGGLEKQLGAGRFITPEFLTPLACRVLRGSARLSAESSLQQLEVPWFGIWNGPVVCGFRAMGQKLGRCCSFSFRGCEPLLPKVADSACHRHSCL